VHDTTEPYGQRSCQVVSQALRGARWLLDRWRICGSECTLDRHPLTCPWHCIPHNMPKQHYSIRADHMRKALSQYRTGDKRSWY
jgi:hypothetical protein